LAARVVLSQSFKTDSSEAYAFLADQSPAAASKLVDAINASIALIADFPQAGRVRDDIDGVVRSFRVAGFAHLVFYDFENDRVTLLRLLHGARDLPKQQFRDLD
jgi:toxin ParE1/3/4